MKREKEKKGGEEIREEEKRDERLARKDRLIFRFGSDCCCESFEGRQGGTFSHLFEG